VTTIDELRQQLDELDDFPVLEAPADGEEAVLAGMQDAVRAARSLWAVSRKRADLAEQAQAEIAELERRIGMVREWLTEVDRPLAARVDYLTGLLEAYALARRASGGRKTLVLPYARVSTREVPGAWQVSDEAVLWALQHRPELVQTKHALPVGAARDAWLSTDGGVFDPVTGAEVPGVTVEPGRLVATVTVLESSRGDRG
jgi:hypothetical protein